jgi:hypothetical protein
MDLNLKPGNMRRPDVNHAIVVLIPIYARLTAHFTKDHVNMLYVLASGAFKDAVGNASPSVIGSELNFDPEPAQHNVREDVRMWIKIDLNFVAGQEFFNYFANAILKGARFVEWCAPFGFCGQTPASVAKQALE